MGIPSIHDQPRTIMARLERQTSLFLNFILTHASLPSLETFTSRVNHSANLYRYRQLVMELEQHIDCLIIWDHWQDEEEVSGGTNAEQIKSEEWNEDLLEMLFYAVKKEQELLKKEEELKGGKDDKKKGAAQPAKKFDMFDDMMGGDDDSDGCDLMDFDFHAAP